MISAELLEHVYDRRKGVSNIKNILVPGGFALITKRSCGFKCHGWPYDFWRYETGDMKSIFSDFEIEYLEKDHSSPGVFMKAGEKDVFVENDTVAYLLYSVVAGRKTVTITKWDVISNIHRLSYFWAALQFAFWTLLDTGVGISGISDKNW